MCDKSRNTWLCVHWQWNTLEWCQLNALQASPVVHLVTPLSCASLSMNTQPSVPTIQYGHLPSNSQIRRPVAHLWRRGMGRLCEFIMTFSNGNSFRVTGEFTAQRPVTRSFDVLFDLRLNKRLSKQWWGWWFETPSHALWRHCNVKRRYTFYFNHCSAIGFNHGVLGLAENPARGTGFFRQNTSGYALGVLTEKARPEGWVFSQAQHPMIKTYYSTSLHCNAAIVVFKLLAIVEWKRQRADIRSRHCC